MIGGACLILGRGEDEIKPERQTSEIQSLHVGKPTDRVRLPGSVRSVLFFSASSDWIVTYVYTTRIKWMRRKQQQLGEGGRKKYIVRYKQSTLKWEGEGGCRDLSGIWLLITHPLNHRWRPLNLPLDYDHTVHCDNLIRMPYCKFWIYWVGVNSKFSIWQEPFYGWVF